MKKKEKYDRVTELREKLRESLRAEEEKRNGKYPPQGYANLEECIQGQLQKKSPKR